MYHVPGAQPVAAGNDRLAGGQAAGVRRRSDVPALFEQLWSSRAVDRAVHSAPSQQAAVGGVDDGVYVENRYIALHERDHDPFTSYLAELCGQPSNGSNNADCNSDGDINE
jgi:hypothetical protein